MHVILAQPRGFCAGVERAIHIVEAALQKYGSPVYVRHEIVHNPHVVQQLRDKGAVFVEELEEIPADAITIFSAHGVAEAIEEEAEQRGLHVIDATCPLVTKVHLEAQRQERDGRQIILIGHKGHPEVEGTSGRVKQEVLLVSSIEEVDQLSVERPDQLSYVTQTTLSVDDTKAIIQRLQARFPSISGPDVKDICYATQNRQDAVRLLAPQCDVVLVLGAVNSSNSNRLRDLAESLGARAYLINDAQDLRAEWLESVATVGITAGASAPEVLVQEVVALFESRYQATIGLMEGIHEKVKFKLPKELTA